MDTLVWSAGGSLDDWSTQAECLDLPSDMMFLKDQGIRKEIIASFCGHCDVREQCLELAMVAEGNKQSRRRYGIFGGLLPSERYRLNKERRIALGLSYDDPDDE